jgi:hypothetical protein
MNGYVRGNKDLISKKEAFMKRLQKDGFDGITLELCDPSAVGSRAHPRGYRHFHVFIDQSLSHESIEIDYSNKNYDDLVSKLNSQKNRRTKKNKL